MKIKSFYSHQLISHGDHPGRKFQRIKTEITLTNTHTHIHTRDKPLTE